MKGNLRATTEEGAVLDASFSVEQTAVGFDLIIESRGGAKRASRGGGFRNPDYEKLAQLVLERAKALGAALRGAWVVSAQTSQLPDASRRLSPPGLRFPVDLSTVDDIRGLRVAISRMQGAIGRRPGASGPGNRNKRMLLSFAMKKQLSEAQLMSAIVSGKGLPQPAVGTRREVGERLTISSDSTIVHEGFERWRTAIADGAQRIGNLWLQPDGRFLFRNQLDPASSMLGLRTALGTDPTGKSWAVQINEATKPGDVNVTSAIALNDSGRPFLLRQGRLRPGSGAKPVTYSEFALRTGLTRANVINGDSHISRDWYVVTPLDVSKGRMRERTARFVDHCALARLGDMDAGSTGDIGVIKELLAGDETGGTYIIPGREATPPKVVIRLQGEAWVLMAGFLREKGISVEKPRPAANYEVDAEINNGEHRLLVEMKSGATAADVYGGVGQLILYRQLMPRLAHHRPVLLLPAEPAKPLVKALASCGVDLCTYDLTKSRNGFRLVLSPRFLKLCGL